MDPNWLPCKCHCSIPPHQSSPGRDPDTNTPVEVLVHRELLQWPSPPQIKAAPLISHHHLDLVLEWLCEVYRECRSHPELFTLSAMIMNKFISVCDVKPNQLQLLAVVASRIASKLRADVHDQCIIREDTWIAYTDRSITPEEIQIWEKLVLAKLNWDVNFVIAHDYFESLIKLADAAAASSSSWPKDVLNSLLHHAHLTAALLGRWSKVQFSYPPRCVAMVSLMFVSKQLKVSSGLGFEVLPESILRTLRLGREDIQGCLSVTERYLWSDMSMPIQTPPSSAVSSPIKAISSSTPKSRRPPLTERAEPNVPCGSHRRRLYHHSLREEEPSAVVLPSTDKENNDSAIGLNVSYFSNDLSPQTTSSGASSSGGSKNSSPDSGASSNSPQKCAPLSPNVKSMDDLLSSINISPLSKATTSS